MSQSGPDVVRLGDHYSGNARRFVARAEEEYDLETDTFRNDKFKVLIQELGGEHVQGFFDGWAVTGVYAIYRISDGRLAHFATRAEARRVAGGIMISLGQNGTTWRDWYAERV